MYTDQDNEDDATRALYADKGGPAPGSSKKLTTPLKAAPKKEGPEKKHSFTSTITSDNKRRLANYQANKPGGAQTTDVLNQALKRFFDTNKQYADVDPVDPGWG
ncbi:MAG TPA: hypothetical protein VF629_15910 [Hymenobacter sp.]|jgi:hypothetical protein|uniref:hypothetical protein n=1 Tax=Hymenobacter sp. TaxID=1898978 RepID=UPI002ED8A712